MTSRKTDLPPGRLRAAPEGFLTAEDIAAVQDGRRDFLAGAFRKALGAGVALAAAQSATARAAADAGDPAILTMQPYNHTLGNPVAAHPYGLPSKYEHNLARRESPGLSSISQASVSFTPLQGLFGIITPSGLHFERHHGGWHDMDPSLHRLMVHGDVRAPRVYTMDDLLRLPSVSRIHFVECGANSAMEWSNVAVPTVQYTHGMLSCSEFTGVPVSILLDAVGIDPRKTPYVLAEGADSASHARTIPIERLLDDAMVAYAMNGEMLRPENGYPLRLIVPGLQGVSQVKWLRRLKVGNTPWDLRDESSQYSDLMPDGSARQYTWIQECKSVITSPSGGQMLLDRGLYNISGVAWSGRGAIKRVDVSVDGGRNWQTATLQTPVLSKALTRFNFSWNWDGSPAILQSRAIDETGYVQPKMNELRAVRGSRSIYHNNAIQSWKVAESGEVSNVQVY
ncbi:MAG: sulfite dehydrogenase [Pseudomonadota bacterium]|nr:sulfite dehydrogenase [Pseudomonadota bacterium]